MPLKICFITNYAYRLFNNKSQIAFGGIETIFYIIAQDLTKDKRFKVNFLLEDDVHKDPVVEHNNGIILYKTSRKIQPKNYVDKQIEKYHRWFTYWAEKYNQLWQIPHLDFFRLWEKLKQIQADVYVFASPGYESGLITLLTKILKKKSIFIVVNDELFNLKDKLFLFGLKHADIVWCFSDRHQAILKKRYQINAVNIPCWYSRPKIISAFNKKEYLLWVGRVESRKQPKVFLQLAKSLPKYKFVMIAAPNPNEPILFKTIIRLAAKIPNLKLKLNVTFSTLDSYYQKALVFIDTSYYKNLNMTQVQAAYCKIPCISMFYDPNDTFKDYHWGVSAKGNFIKLIQNTQRVLSEKILWQKLSYNAYKFADTVYNSENNLNSFKKIMLQFKHGKH